MVYALAPVNACKDMGELAQLRSAPGARALLRWLLRLAFADVALWALYAALAAGVQPASRRACNAAYAAWLLSLNLLLLLALAAADALCSALQQMRGQARHASLFVSVFVSGDMHASWYCTSELAKRGRACSVFLVDMEYRTARKKLAVDKAQSR